MQPGLRLVWAIMRDCKVWCNLVAVAAVQVNEEKETAEQTKKDICNQRREQDSHVLFD